MFYSTKMKMPASFLAMVAGFCVALGSIAPAVAGDELPSAEQLLDKYVEVTGGKAAYEKLTSQVRRGKMVLAPMNQTITLEIFNQAPNKMVQVAENEMMGKTTMGCDGEHVWMDSAMMGGAQLLEGERAALTIAQALFMPDLNWRERFEKVETVGSETVDGKEYYKVVRTPKLGEPETIFINKETNLIEMLQTKAQSPMGEVEVETTFGDFKKSGDITSARKTIQKMAGMEQVITFDEVKYNVEIDLKLFVPPDAIQKQIQKQKESDDKPTEQPAKQPDDKKADSKDGDAKSGDDSKTDDDADDASGD